MDLFIQSSLSDNRAFKPYGVGECWDRVREIEDWLNEANARSGNPVSAFDFPLRDNSATYAIVSDTA